MTFSQINCNAAGGNLKGAEMELRGTKGTMYIDMDHWEVVPEMNAAQEIPARTPLDRGDERAWSRSRKPAMEESHAKGSINPAPHARNFLDCVRSRKQTNCDTLTGHLSTAATLIGNVALRTRSYLEGDSKTESFTNNPAANQWLSYHYRAPYKLG